jgi:hypothetical protein
MLTNVCLINVNLEHYGLKPLFAKTNFQNFIWLFEIGHFFCPFSKSQFTFWKKKLKYFSLKTFAWHRMGLLGYALKKYHRIIYFVSIMVTIMLYAQYKGINFIDIEL